MTESPTPRLALTRAEAAAALAMSLDSFERYCQPNMRLVRIGRMRLVPVTELDRWLREHAETVLARGGWSRLAEGISIIEGANGTRSYRAFVYDRSVGKKIRKTFPTHAAARAWRTEAQAAVRAGRIRAVQAPRFDELFGREVDGRWKDGTWIEGAYHGVIRTRGRRPFKDSTHPLGPPALPAPPRAPVRPPPPRRGPAARTSRSSSTPSRWRASAPSTIEGTILPLRLAYRWARSKGIIAVDPTDGIELPEKPRGTRVPPSPAGRRRPPRRASAEADRAMWATAMLAGLRRGELLALRWEDIDLDAGILSVTRSFNPDGGVFSSPKSRYGIRKVPIGASLATYLRAHALLSGRRAGLVFGNSATWPQRPESMQDRADLAWSNANAVAAALAAGEGRGATAAAAPRDAPRLPPPLRLDVHRRRRQRPRALQVHGPLRHPGHLRPLRPPVPGQRGRSQRPPRRLPADKPSSEDDDAQRPASDLRTTRERTCCLQPTGAPPIRQSTREVLATGGAPSLCWAAPTGQ